jgi:mono/diheme cytochrome c family protein
MQRHMVTLALFMLVVFSGGACNSLDEPGPVGDSVVVVPVDARAVTAPLQAPAAINGGTLAVTPDGQTAVVADPDRQRVSIVGLTKLDVRHIALEPGDEPGRVLAADSGRAYVALRRAGAVAVIDLVNASLLQRVPVCAAPRGLALQASTSLLHVACAEGRLVSLRAAAGMLMTRPERDVRLESDLRDVMVQGDALLVSTFKRAELLRLDANGGMQARVSAATFQHPALNTKPDGANFPTAISADASMQPHLAFRSVTDATGQVFMLHQGATTEVVKIDEESTKPDPNGASAYGGGGAFACGGIVGPALTRIDRNGTVATVPVRSGVLSVDMTLVNGGRELAVIQAGGMDSEAPRPQVVFDADADFFASTPRATTSAPVAAFATETLPDGVDLRRVQTSQLTVFGTSWPADGGSCQIGRSLMIHGQGTAVVARKLGDGVLDQLLVQSREPALLSIVTEDAARGPTSTVIALGGESVLDTGHEIFHRDAGAGVACASCHPGGAEDGHVWNFNTVGLRRTQALHVGLEGTAPFHWNGEERDLGVLMEHVFVGRMGGVHQNPERQKALERYLFSLQPPAAAQPQDMEAVHRGEALFASPDVGCRGCHVGDKLTDNRSLDVGTGGKLQVPSLRAVAYRAPFMHNGCATRLRDRFDPACGGSAHGNVKSLSGDQIDDLVAYLQTL